MASIGAEVGQKMRSAIKAKLLELNCYVDDELPDYVMVMVANKRTKSQMKEDLQLFLAAKTGTFVDWLHIVLKKLKEVTVTNPEVYKKAPKRKVEEIANNIDVKKEKKDKKEKKAKKSDSGEESSSTEPIIKSLTDDLPINANRLSEQRKIIIMKETKSNHDVITDSFDIPLLSEVNLSTEEELEDIERKIKTVQSRLGLLVESDEDQDCITLKTEHDDLFSNSKNEKPNSKFSSINNNATRVAHARITFSADKQEANVRKSVLNRLGRKRHNDKNADDFKAKKTREDKREKHSWREERRNKMKFKESILSRLGVMSKVSVPQKVFQEPEAPLKAREVPSMIKVKPRMIPADAAQPNKNLLLKAVADAQRSIAQTPTVGNKPEALYTKKYKDKLKDEQLTGKKPNKMNTEEYTPPVEPEIVSEDESQTKQQFIITMNDFDPNEFKELRDNVEISIKSRLQKKRTPSPIVFGKVNTTLKTKSNIPDKLPVVVASPSIKNKERCKYWPNCRQGDKCEFVHPSITCEKFPHCKFREKCLYIHPNCKFGSSCTRRDCVYSHANNKQTVVPAPVGVPSICHFFPNCTNANCAFYHPKPCKFGKYCKNQSECIFSHLVPSKSSLTWRPSK